MNPELLKMYEALQPFFRERRGDIQWGDDYADPQGKVYRIIPGGFSQFKYWKDSMKGHTWLPRTIDDSSPEAQARSLWGMCRDIICLNNNGEDNFEVCILLDDGRGEIWDERSHKGATPTEALLRALCAQEGVEV